MHRGTDRSMNNWNALNNWSALCTHSGRLVEHLIRLKKIAAVSTHCQLLFLSTQMIFRG